MSETPKISKLSPEAYTVEPEQRYKSCKQLSHQALVEHTATDPRDRDACALEWAGRAAVHGFSDPG